MKILITGAAGFIGTHLVEEFLRNGWEVVGIDNFSRYGKPENFISEQQNYKLIEGDVKNTELLVDLLQDCDYLVALAAVVGGISDFQKFAYEMLVENTLISIATFNAAIKVRRNNRRLKKIVFMSSTMVYERTSRFPTPEEETDICPPPHSSYACQKLYGEYLARNCQQVYGLPYTIFRLSNCIGTGEKYSEQRGSHVIMELAKKIIDGQDPLQILGTGEQVRCFIHVRDVCRAICLALTNKKSDNEIFNISSAQSVKIKDLAAMLWEKIHKNKLFHYICDQQPKFDTLKSIPDITKARKLLGFEATIPLNDSLDEIVAWIRTQLGVKKTDE